MTRQKKEIIKKISEREAFIEADMALGCGFAPTDFYEPLEREIADLYEELAHIRHYKDGLEMQFDERGMIPYYADDTIPFH